MLHRCPFPSLIGGDDVIGFWHDHSLLEVFDCKICLCIFFFLNETSATVQTSGRKMREKCVWGGGERLEQAGATTSHLRKCAAFLFCFLQFKASCYPIHALQLCSQPCNNKKENGGNSDSHNRISQTTKKTTLICSGERPLEAGDCCPLHYSACYLILGAPWWRARPSLPPSA